MFKLAELFVDISAKDDALRKSVGGLKSELSAMGVAIGTAAGNLAASAIARATSAIAGFFSGGIKGAVALQDTLAATGAIFGDAAGIITAKADEMAKKFGTVKTEFINASQGFGAAFKAIGTPVDDAARLGNQLAKLGMDMASFKGTSNAEAFTALSAALRGEFDPLERFNVMLSAAAIEQEALSMGLIKSAKDMDEAAKKQATLSLIMKKSVDMQGDLERTAGDTGNAWRKFTGTLQNTADSIGMSLMPAISAVTTALGEMATYVASSVEANKEAIKGWAESIAAAIRAVPDAWDTFVAALAIAFIKVDEFGQNAVAVFMAFTANAARIGGYIAGNWRELIVDAVNAVSTAFQNLGENLMRLGSSIVEFLKDPTRGFHFEWKPLLEGFKATADELPEMLKPKLADMSGAIAAVGEDLNRKITDRAKAAAAAAQAATSPARAAATAAAKKAKDFKSESSSVSEFALKLRSSIYEGQDDTPKQQLDQLKQINAKIKEAIADGDRKRTAVLG